MQGRFSRIFELFNQRNTEYYQQAFDRLEKENKTTFNFAAALCWAMWLVYRKMYGWAILFVLAFTGIPASLNAFYQNSKVATLISAVLYLVTIIGFGFFGNSLYYKHVKSKVAKGYAEITNYNSIDPVWGIVVIGVVLPLLVGVSAGILMPKHPVSKNVFQLLTMLIQVFFIAIPWMINYKKFHSQESVEPVEVTEESVNAYLEKANPKRLTVSMCTMIVSYLLFLLILSMMSVLAVVGMKTTGKKVLNQLDKIGEEVSKMPNDSIKGVKIRIDDETEKQSVELSAEFNKKVAKKEKNSSEVSEKTTEAVNGQEKSVRIEKEVADQQHNFTPSED